MLNPKYTVIIGRIIGSLRDKNIDDFCTVWDALQNEYTKYDMYDIFQEISKNIVFADLDKMYCYYPFKRFLYHYLYYNRYFDYSPDIEVSINDDLPGISINDERAKHIVSTYKIHNDMIEDGLIPKSCLTSVKYLVNENENTSPILYMDTYEIVCSLGNYQYDKAEISSIINLWYNGRLSNTSRKSIAKGLAQQKNCPFEVVFNNPSTDVVRIYVQSGHKLDDVEIISLSDYIDWGYLKYTDLSENIMHIFCDKLDWKWIFANKKISDEFMSNHSWLQKYKDEA